jgi:hypothetical protein
MDTRFNELGIEIYTCRQAVGLPDCVGHSDEDYCESFNLSPQESQEHIIFMKTETSYDNYSLRFFCDDSEPHLI